MKAVKAVIVAEDNLANVYVEEVPKRESKKKRSEREAREIEARRVLNEARGALRAVHTEVLKEEYGP